MVAASFASSICNAGSLNILGSAVTDGVREGFEKLAGDRDIRAVILAGQSEKSMIGGADIKEMAKLDQKSAGSLHHPPARSLRGRAQLPCARDRAACPAGASAAGSKSPPPAISGLPRMTPNSACRRCGSAFPR